MQGKSLAKIITGDEKTVRDSAFHAYIHKGKPGVFQTQHAVFDGRWKMIRYHVDGQLRFQLFDISADPDEIHDLSKDVNRGERTAAAARAAYYLAARSERTSIRLMIGLFRMDENPQPLRRVVAGVLGEGPVRIPGW